MTFPNWHIHTSYIVIAVILAVGSYVGVHSWLAEHDARLLAEQKIAVAEQTVKSLNQQITDRDAVAAQQQQVIVRVVHDTQTPQQAAIALPQVVSQPLATPVVAQTNGDWLVPEADVLPLFAQLGDDKVCKSKLDTCTQDLTDEKSMVVDRDKEIAVLKHPKGFWGHVKSSAKEIGIGVGVGLLLTHL